MNIVARATSAKTAAPPLKLAPEDDIWRDYDHKKTLAAIKRMAGKWSDMDTEKLADDIGRWRKEGSRP